MLGPVGDERTGQSGLMGEFLRAVGSFSRLVRPFSVQKHAVCGGGGGVGRGSTEFRVEGREGGRVVGRVKVDCNFPQARLW